MSPRPEAMPTGKERTMNVTIEGLCLSYGGVSAVQDLDLAIGEGESIVLLGQSGCGKTSTMRCVAGLETPSAGRITIGDRAVFDGESGRSVPSHKRNVGMVFQSYAVWPHKTVIENVAFPLRMKGQNRTLSRAKAFNVLELVGLGHLTHRGASQLSNGQIQRVALTRNIAIKPSILLLNEPLSNLNTRLRNDLRIKLRRIQLERGLTSLYVTHDQQEALALADRIAIMQSGGIQQLGTPQEIYRAPATASIAKFLGVTNVFRVERGGDQGLRLDGHSVSLRSAHPVPNGPISVAVRPEAVTVHEAQPADNVISRANRLAGTVRVAVYQGSSVRYQVSIDGGPELDVVSLDPIVLPPGTPVVVEVPEAAVSVLPDDRPAPSTESATTAPGSTGAAA